MSKLKNEGRQLKKMASELSKILNKKDRVSDSDKKNIIKLFIKLDEVKKGIVSILFGRGENETSARKRIIEYLKENVGKKVSGNEIAQVAGISEYARRIRELRHEHGGWQISTGMNRSDLRPNEYVLEDLKQRPSYERMNAKIWKTVLERDNFTCLRCGWGKGDPQRNSRRFLEVHHKNPVKAKGKPSVGNLITLCNVCHDAEED